MERRNYALPRKSVRLGYTTLLYLGFLCVAWGYKPPRPLSSTLLPHYEQTPFCQALPQAAPRNYSLMPQTGEMGVCYTLHAELRKTTTVGPLFVNQTQGQKTKHYLPHPESITVENCRAKEHCIDLLFVYLFTCFYHASWFVMSFDTLSLSQQGSGTVPSQQHHFRQGELFYSFIFTSTTEAGNGDMFSFPTHQIMISLSVSIYKYGSSPLLPRLPSGWKVHSYESGPVYFS